MYTPRIAARAALPGPEHSDGGIDLAVLLSRDSDSGPIGPLAVLAIPANAPPLGL
jgi:hypothetical protein